MSQLARSIRPLRQLVLYLLLLALLLPSVSVSAETSHGFVTGDRVLFRKGPNTSDYWDYLDTGWVAQVLSTTTSRGFTWYRVKANIPTAPDREYIGYIRGDFFIMMTQEQETAWLQNKTQPFTGAVIPAPGGGDEDDLLPQAGTLTTIKGGVNLRVTPGGLSIAQIDRGITLPYTGFSQAAGYTWYLVDTAKGRGYLRSDCVRISDTGGIVLPPSDGAMGYIVTFKSAINLRKNPSSSALVMGRVDIRRVYPMVGPVVNAGGFNWYEVEPEGIRGFLRGDCVRQMTAAEVTNYLENGVIPGPTPPIGGGNGESGHVITVLPRVNVRSSPSLDARTLGQIPLSGAVYPLQSTLTSGGRLWFKITYNTQDAYLYETTARMMTAQEYEDYLDDLPGPTLPPLATATPRPEDMSNTAITVMERVLVRAGGGSNYKSLTLLYKQGTIAILQGVTAQTGGYTWYKVKAGGVTGWIRGDMLRILTKEEEKLLNDAGDPDAPRPASYRTLMLGSTGEDVTRLQLELNRLGYLLSGYITGTYNSQTVTAVKAYQKANGLFIDGIAGNNTQHKMYNTVPEDTYNPDGQGTVNPTIYPMELVDWYRGDINSFWGRGETAIMTDVKTRISLRIKRWAGAYHMDGEPLTSADSAALCSIYGVKKTQEILEKNLYQRRPVWITLKGRSFAASLYGVPHNYPEGDTIAGNDFNGQLCVHFLNCKTHGSGVVDADHMKAIQEAYNAAPSRK